MSFRQPALCFAGLGFLAEWHEDSPNVGNLQMLCTSSAALHTTLGVISCDVRELSALQLVHASKRVPRLKGTHGKTNKVGGKYRNVKDRADH